MTSKEMVDPTLSMLHHSGYYILLHQSSGWITRHCMNIICEIEANPACRYSGTEPYVNGQTDGRHAPYHNTTDFHRAYKKQLGAIAQ